MATLSIRVKESELSAIKDYANAYGITISDCIKKAVIEKIEDEYDLKWYEQALEDFKKDPTTYSLEEVMKNFDL